MKTFVIYFEHIPPSEYMSPRYYISTEATIVEAETKDGAAKEFFKFFSSVNPHHLNIKLIEEK
jgi:hypothetical protein